jgi:general secretion pathway protein F
MAIYEYRGVNRKGKYLKGIVDAASLNAAREKLKTQGVYLQEIDELRKSGGRINLSLTAFRKRATIASITRQLSFLISAALPVDSALEGVIDQTDDHDVKKMMIDIKEKVKEGKSVSQAFASYPNYFNSMYVSTLHAGEISGRLDEVFERLSKMFEKNQILINRLRTSLTYPALMIVFAVVIVVFLMSFLVPTFSKIFIEFEQVLPLPTRVLIGVSKIFTSGCWAMLIFFILAVFVFNRLYKNENGKKYFDRMALKIPLVKKLILDTFKIRFSYTMGLMLSNGVGIIESLENTRGVFKNGIFRETVDRAIGLIEKGEKLSRALATSTLFNSSILGMINAGEAGDRVPEVLEKIGSNTELELEEKVKTLTSLVEPVIILIIGVFIGFTILAIMLPIFQINQIFG